MKLVVNCNGHPPGVFSGSLSYPRGVVRGAEQHLGQVRSIWCLSGSNPYSQRPKFSYMKS